MKSSEITRRQKQLYQIIVGFVTSSGRFPIQQELAMLMGSSRQSVSLLLGQLEKHNLIQFDKTTHRMSLVGIKLIPHFEKSSGERAYKLIHSPGD